MYKIKIELEYEEEWNNLIGYIMDGVTSRVILCDGVMSRVYCGWKKKKMKIQTWRFA